LVAFLAATFLVAALITFLAFLATFLALAGASSSSPSSYYSKNLACNSSANSDEDNKGLSSKTAKTSSSALHMNIQNSNHETLVLNG